MEYHSSHFFTSIYCFYYLLVTTSEALVTRSDALVSTSFFLSFSHLFGHPEVRSLDTAQCYDGWFDRRLPRTRLTEPSAESESPLPEPFDLSDGGYEKVRHPRKTQKESEV